MRLATLQPSCLRSLGRHVILLIPLLGTCAVAQIPAPAEQKPDYSQEPFVIEQFLTRVNYERDGTASSEYMLRVRILSESAVRQYGLLMFQYQSAYEKTNIDYVRVRKPDGTVIETPLRNVQDMAAEITRVAPMYTDLRAKHVAVKALAPGDVLEYRAISQMHTPVVPGHFWFQHAFEKDAIVLDEQLQVSVPKNHYVKIQSPEVEPSVADVGKRRIYTWKTSHRVREPSPEEIPSPVVGKYPPPPVQLTTFRSWEEVGHWYGALQRPRVKPTPEIRVKAMELTEGAANDSEKFRLLYHYVATKFRYVSLSFGIGRYQPHAAAEVFSNQYGDCKDKHTLLASMLDALGLKIYPALINTTYKVDPEIPSPGQFDHLVSVVPQGADFVWLDTTTEIAPFGFLTSNLRDKLALVIPDDAPASLVRTAANLPTKNLLVFQAEGKLNDEGTLEADVQSSIRGDGELVFRAAFRQTPQLQWKDLVQSISYRWGFGGAVSNVTVSSPEDTELPFKLAYHYSRENYSNWENQRILPPLPRMVLPVPPEEDSPGEQILLGGPGEIIYRSQVELPSEFTPQLPAAKDIKTDFADYHATYQIENGVLQAERRLIIKVRHLNLDQTEKYQTFQQAVSENERTYVVLATEETAPLMNPTNPEAQRLLAEGTHAVQRNDFGVAQDYFMRAVSLDPNYGAAWLALGYSQLRTNEVDEAVKSFRKAIQADPALHVAHETLAATLTALHRPEEAVQTWRGLLEIDPQNRDAAADLGSLLVGLDRYSEAVSELEPAVKLNPDSSQLHFVLGQAYLRTGKEEEALGMLEKAVELNPGPSAWNNVAYELVEHSNRFAEALEYAQKAVEAREQETASITLKSLKSTDLRIMWELGAAWDSLGWIHFHLGNLDPAEKYLYASWMLRQEAVVGDHLGQLYEKQEKKESAVQAYALALGTGRKMPDTRKRLKRLLGSGSQAETAVGKAREELGRMRTVKLDRLTSKRSSAEFFILFAPGPIVEDVKFIRGAEELRQATGALASADYTISFPDDGPTKLIRRGILMCVDGVSGCEFVLLTPDVVRSLN